MSPAEQPVFDSNAAAIDKELARVAPLVALDGDELIASGSLHIMPHECMRHVGHIRLVTARARRGQGLGGLLTRELVALFEKNFAQFAEAVSAEVRAAGMK